jgi:2-polyprenyl-6-methoxyphenol hydroxylase-like FAD-dependent oxidoreductase
VAKIDYDVDVLIAGAGPAGLMMACQLVSHNISFRIIDKKASPAIHSGALIIHARTLEILDQMGLAEKAIEMGIIARSINIRFNSKKIEHIDISKLGVGLSRFPFFLMLEQWQTENLLKEFLKGKDLLVESNTELLKFTNEGEHVTSQIKTPDGKIELIKSRFLIGADGNNSLVRTQLNIPFHGKTHKSRLFITDCDARLPLSAQEIFFSFTAGYTAGFFPMSGNRWRTDGLIPVMQEKADAGFEDVKNFFAANIDSGIELHNPQWFSVFRSHSRCASSFRLKQCFLVGDAAHIHSPVGAQGMNTGLQDSYNLAWKLAFYIHGKASEILLDTYEEERRPVALNIIRNTDLAYSFMTSGSFLARVSRLRLVPLLLPMFLTRFRKNEGMQNNIFKAISGTGIQYGSNLPTSLANVNFPVHAPKPGERLPYLEYVIDKEHVSTHDNLNSTHYNLLVFGKPALPLPFQTVVDENSDMISVKHIIKESGTKHLFDAFGIKDEGCYLVRPDLYIAWRGHEFDAIDFGSYLQKHLK